MPKQSLSAYISERHEVLARYGMSVIGNKIILTSLGKQIAQINDYDNTIVVAEDHYFTRVENLADGYNKPDDNPVIVRKAP